MVVLNGARLLPVLLVLLVFTADVIPQRQFADIVILNADVRTMNKASPRAEAIAISGSRIAAVGSSRETAKLAGPQTVVIDAGGKLVLPGFNDAHVHFMAIGNRFSSIDLRGAASPAEMSERIANYAAFLPKGRWILGGQWDHLKWSPAELPDRNAIDAASPDNPVLIYHSDPNTALANSLALRLAGISRTSKTAYGADIARDEHGEPTGIIRNKAIGIFSPVIPRDHMRQWSGIAETATNYAASLGVTSVQDMHSDDMTEIYRELERKGKLKTRVYDCIPLEDHKKLSALSRPADAGDMVRSGCLKSFADLGPEAAESLNENVAAAARGNGQVMLHAIGGRTVGRALDAFESAGLGFIDKRRFRIEHASGLQPEEIKRIRRDNFIASVQPFLFGGGNYRPLVDAGITIAFGSDAPMVEFDPLLGIHAAVSRGSMTVEEAVHSYTLASAFAEFQESEKGSIETGKLADIIILSANIFAAEPPQIREASVVMTIVGGKIVYRQQSGTAPVKMTRNEISFRRQPFLF